MGIGPFSSHRCSCSTTPTNNPDPSKYTVKRQQTIGNFLLMEVNYPDCKNFEGNKILLFENVDIVTLLNTRKIDPHFSKTYVSPVARFIPTEEGWKMAVKLANMLKKPATRTRSTDYDWENKI
jgi:hypothetical protein